MKVLIVSAKDILGGAHKAAYRLHRGLLDHNIHSQMIVQNKISDDYTVIGPTSNFRTYLMNPLRPIWDHIIMKLNKINTLFSSSYFPFSEVVNQINKIQPDVVHLHWITGGMMRIEDISKINAPIVWSCQDMWAFTGGCHFSGDCDFYKENCGNCPVLKSNKRKDLSKKIFDRKLKSYSQIKNLTIIGVSKWMADCAQNSFLFSKKTVENIPNCIDTNLFKPINKETVRDIFNIPINTKVILFGSTNPEDKRKGARELFNAINLLDLKIPTVFVIAGCSPPKKKMTLKYPIYYIPPLTDEVSLPIMYNIADVLVIPSLEENLSNSIIESLSCGVPVVSFDIGGNGDMIEHKKNGYLAEKLNSEDLSRGITWVLENRNYEKLSINARQKVLSEFDSNVVITKYIKLYEEIKEIQNND